MEQEIEAIGQEVKEFADRLIQKAEEDEELGKLYKGTQIFFSPVVKNPQILFLGINPGSGYFNNVHKPVYKFEPQEQMEYVSEEYALSDDWKYVFGYGCYKDRPEKENLHRPDILENACKTNCFFFATKDSADLKKLIRLSGKYFGAELVEKSKDWTRRIVRFLEPEIIICEGKLAFEYFENFFRPEVEIVDNGDDYKCAKLGNSTVLMFSRRVDSRFKDIETVIDRIADFL
ncbi:MAG: hypothetical protein HDR56_06765 [Treponema sp.]|nr:hypothetical protein [Treponema sp.]